MSIHLDILLVLACVQGGSAAAPAPAPPPAPERNAATLVRVRIGEDATRLTLESDALPGQVFSLAPPQYIGHEGGVLVDAQQAQLEWRGPDSLGAYDLVLVTQAVAYAARVVPFHDHVDLIETLENRSAESWKHAFTFACCRAELAPAFRDPELAGTFAAFDGKASSLGETSGVGGVGDIGDVGGVGRPAPAAIEFYWPREGGPRAHAFVDRFKTTSPRQVSASYLATRSDEGEGVFGIACRKAAFLYRNITRACRHVAPDFGDLAPGARGFALTRVYLLAAGADTFVRRHERDFAGGAVAASMRVAKPAGPFVALHGVDVFPPWPAAGYVTLRFPETLSSSLGLLYIDHERADMVPVARASRPAVWQAEPSTGALVGRLELPGLAAFTSRAAPEAEGVDFSFKVENLNARRMEDIRVQMCLVESDSPLFGDRNLTRTFIVSGGRWLPLARSTYPRIFPDDVPRLKIGLLSAPARERPQNRPPTWATPQEMASLPLIATRSPDGEALLGYTWKDGSSLVCNGSIPCLHVDPEARDCAPRATILLEGRMYLVRESLDALQQRFLAEQGRSPASRR